MGYWNKQVFTSILLGILFSILFASTVDSQSDEEKNIASIPFIQPASAQQVPLPDPILRFTTAEEYYADGTQYFQYHLTVDNWQNYTQYLFGRPDPLDCGSNDNLARTWVDIFNAQTDVRINRFCTFDSPNDLTKLWFEASATSTPPSVYVKLIDRQIGNIYTSNIVTIAKPEPSSLPSPTPKTDVTTPTGYTKQESYSGNCKYRQPSGTTCLEYSDGYLWLISDSFWGWEGMEEYGRGVSVAIGSDLFYYHMLDTDFVKIGSSLITQGTLDYVEQKSYSGDCDERPSGTECIEYPDGYIWIVLDSIQGWEDLQEDGENVKVAVGNNARYYHILNPNLVWIGPLEPERYPNPNYVEIKPYSKDCGERKLGTVCAKYGDGYILLISDSVRDWEEIQIDGKDVQVVVGFKSRYYHLLNPNLIKTDPLVTQAAPEPEPETVAEPVAEPEPDAEPEPVAEPVTTKRSFVDPEKDPQSYVDRYNNEESYKEWFDRNFPGYTIYEAVGLPEPAFEPPSSTETETISVAEPVTTKPKPRPSFIDPEKDPQSYVDRYNNEESYKEWFDSNFPDYTIYEAVGLAEPAKEKIAGWIKNNAKWWSEGQIGDSDFTSGIQHLMKEKIINIPDLPEQASEVAEEKVPDWIKNNAGWWADGLISEEDFLNGIKYLVGKGIIKV